MMEDQLYEAGFVVYELDQRGDDRKVVGFGTNSAIALAAHKCAAALYPQMRFQTRHRARIIADTAEQVRAICSQSDAGVAPEPR